MKMKFVGDYTNGHTSITMGNYVFEGREPVEVDATSPMGRKLLGNPDFEAISPLDHDGDGEKGGSLAGEQSTVKRGRRKKAA
jgi:hypothetical protein